MARFLSGQTAGSAHHRHGITFTPAGAWHRMRRNRDAETDPTRGRTPSRNQIPYPACGCTCWTSNTRTVVMVPSADALYPVSAAPPTHSDAACCGLPHSSGVSDVTVAATSVSTSWQITGTAVPDAPSNDTDQASGRMSVVFGTPICKVVLAVAATRGTTVGMNGAAVARGLAKYSTPAIRTSSPVPGGTVLVPENLRDADPLLLRQQRAGCRRRLDLERDDRERVCGLRPAHRRGAAGAGKGLGRRVARAGV